MNSTIKQIFIGLFISMIVLSISIGGGLYLTGNIEISDIISDSDDKKNSSEVKLINSTLDSSTIAEESLQSVVTIYSGQNEGIKSQGTGFVYDNGYIMTNHHVIDGSNELYIKYNGGIWTDATLVGSDEYTDIAILEPQNVPSYAESLTLMEDIPVRGNPVIALGSPVGLSGSVTTGIISGTNRVMSTETEFTIPDSIQTDAALNQGNSGGPLVMTNTGKVAGVNTATEGENIGFAVSARLADAMGQSIIETGDHEHSYVGIRTIELSPIVNIQDDIDVEKGLLVEEVVDGSLNDGVLRTREDADLPDVIVGINGNDIHTNEGLTSYLMRETTPGDTVNLDVYRNGTVQNVNIELGSR